MTGLAWLAVVVIVFLFEWWAIRRDRRRFGRREW